MQRLTEKDLWPNPVYERSRDEYRRHIIELKRPRRIALGESVTVFFENRETVKFQIQEMLRAEGISTPEGVRAEIEVYDGLLPGPDELSATLTIEVTEEARIPETLRRLVGIEEALWLVFAGHEVRASFEAGRSDGARISAVQFVRFRLTPEERAGLLGAGSARLELRHPGYEASVVLSPATLASLRGDLAE